MPPSIPDSRNHHRHLPSHVHFLIYLFFFDIYIEFFFSVCYISFQSEGKDHDRTVSEEKRFVIRSMP